MMFRLRLLFILLLPVCFLHAQLNIDSLEILVLEKNKIPKEELTTIYHQLSQHYAFVNPTLSLKYAKELKENAKVIQNLNVQGTAFRTMGVAHVNLRDYDKSLSCYINALTSFEQVNNEKNIGLIYSDIAELYLIKGDFTQAEEYFDKSIPIFKKINETQYLSRCLMGLAHLYSSSDKLVESREMYHEALAIIQQNGSKKMLSSAFANLAQTYNDEDEATTYRLMDSALFYANNTGLIIKAEIYQAYGDAKIKFKDYKEALELLKKCETTAEGKLVGDLLLRNIESKSRCYKNLGDFTKTIELMELQLLLTDSIYNDKSEEKYKKFQALFETQQKENQILAYQEEELSYRNKLILLIAIVIILLLGGLIVYLNHKRKVERLNYQIHQRDSELTGFAIDIIEKNKILKNVKKQLKDNKDVDQLNPFVLSENIELDEKLIELEQSFQFNLSNKHPSLSNREKKVCSLLKLNFSSKDIAELLNVSSGSVDTYRYRIRKKMGINKSETLLDALNKV